MSFNLDQGLFQLDFTDHHAILGVSIDANSREIRKRYMRIAKFLHPDSGNASTPEEKERASQVLSKLVNPAYEKLTQDKEVKEYMVMLKLKGQQANQQGAGDKLQSDAAKKLAESKNVEAEYKQALADVAARQYESLNNFTESTGEISELNLVYLMRLGGQSLPAPSKSKPSKSQASSPSKPAPGVAPPPPKVEKKSPVEGYYGRAKELVDKQNFPKAILELRDALKFDPTNSDCHTLLGEIYLKQKQHTMAKVHLNKALESQPNNEQATILKQKVESALRKKASASSTKNDPKAGQGIKIFGITIGGGKKK